MKLLSDLREILYPLEWFFRFAIIALLLILVNRFYPDDYFTYPVMYYLVVFAMFAVFLIQVYMALQWLRNNRQ